MDLAIPSELEELILCSCCHLPFNETDAAPKLFSCRHHFCLKCVNSILLKGNDLYCVHCWKRTELPGPGMKPENLPTYNAILYLSQNLNMLNLKTKPPDKQTSGSQQNLFLNSNIIKKDENCMTHAMPNALWCTKCNILVCRACAGSEDHRNHTIKTHNEAKETINSEINEELLIMQKMLNEVQHLVLKQRDFLLKILESCTSLKTQLETELINHFPTLEIAEIRDSLGKAKLCLDMLENQSPTEAYKLYATLIAEKQRLQTKHHEMYLQCKLDDLIRHYGVIFDFNLIKESINNIQVNNSFPTINGTGHTHPILILANYCISQLYSRNLLMCKNTKEYHSQPQQIIHNQFQVGQSSPRDEILHKSYADIATNSPTPNQQHSNGYGNNHLHEISHHGQTISSPNLRTNNAQAYLNELNGMSSAALSIMKHHMHHQHSNSLQKNQLTVNGLHQVSQNNSLICNPSVHVYPIYYFNIEMNGTSCGRILIEVRNDVAPKMCKNFGALASNELGFGYKGCQIFQCWENESIITGDFELNNGRGGRSVFDESFFMPDDTKILAIRGSVGMRRSQKRHDNLGLVGSQFRIILREMRGFTGIFGFVVEGLELVEKISQTGDSAGKPQSNITIASCGKLQ